MTNETDLLNTLGGGDNQTPQGTTPDNQQGDPLADLVGDGKKFKDVKDLARGKIEADRFVKQLQDENAKMRDKLKELEHQSVKQQTLTQLMDEIRQASQGGTGNQSQNITTEEILKVVDSRVQEREQEQARAANRAKSNALILNKFNGDSDAALKFVKKRAEELRVPSDQLKAMAEQSPDAFAQLLGLNQQRETRQDTGGSPVKGGNVNSEAFALPNSGERNQAYYNKLRKEMGFSKFHANHALQKQLYADMDRLGDKFFE